MQTSSMNTSLEEKIRSKITDGKLKDVKIFAYTVTDSTNTRAREYAEQGNAVFPAVFVADGQSAGRGRRGRSFDSAVGDGLYISFLFRPAAADTSLITVRAAVDTALAIEDTAGLRVGIKWVNDIFVGGKKLAGILTEGRTGKDGRLEYAVCGIGINLNERSFPKELSGIATTLEGETGEKPNRELLAARLIERFFSENDGFLAEYKSRSTVIGKNITVYRISGESFFARAVDVTDSGALAVIREDGEREELISAEVSVAVRQ